MLSAAHVLAMDAKNLLDVVDSIRVRYPELFVSNTPSHDPSVVGRSQIDAHQFSTPSIDDNFEMSQQQTYQNLSEIADQMASLPSPSDANMATEELYANQQQLDAQNRYDTDGAISGQLNKMSVSNDATTSINNSVDSIAAPKLPPAKPPVAAKPANLQQKLKANLSSSSTHVNDGNAIASTANCAEDSLKIIEHEQDLYSNVNKLSK